MRIINADGTGSRRVARIELDGVLGFDWSPDGETIAYGKSVPWAPLVDCGEIWLMDVSTGRSRRILREHPIAGLAWSPDGKRIAFGADAGAEGCAKHKRGLWIVNSDGTDLRHLGMEAARAPSWSPDGTMLAVDDWRNTCHACGEIWIARSDGSGQRLLVGGAFESIFSSPDWSPDGKRLVYTDETGVWTINANGSGKKRILSRAGAPDW